MLFLISPAKSLDFETKVPAGIGPLASLPRFLTHSAELIGMLRQQTAADMSALMDLSDALSTLNVERYRVWSPEFTPANSKPAAFAFSGDVYTGLDATTLSAADMVWAQDHLAILSGLYGVLRPLDLLQPYRLEMGTRLENERGRNLYAFWGDLLVEHLNAQLATDKSPVIVNLASQEYFKAVDRQTLQPRVIECVFEDWKGGVYKVISFFAKRARGAMARYAIQHRVVTPAELRHFNVDGYAFEASVSEPDRLVFRRKAG